MISDRILVVLSRPFRALGRMGAIIVAGLSAVLILAAATKEVDSRWSVAIAAFMVVYVQLLLARKLRLEVHDTCENLYLQIESLSALRDCLNGRTSLPPFRGAAVSADLALFLHEWVRRNRPKLILELGSGSSTVVLAAAAGEVAESQVVSLESDSGFARRTRTMISNYSGGLRAEVRDAPLTEIFLNGTHYLWYDTSAISDLSNIDLVFVDGPVSTSGPFSRYPALPLLVDRLASNGVIVVDDANRRGEKVMIEMWRREIPGLNVEELPVEKGAVVISLTAPRATSGD